MFIMINQRPSIGEVGERIGTDLEIQFTLDCDSHHNRVTTVFTQHIICKIRLKIQFTYPYKCQVNAQCCIHIDCRFMQFKFIIIW